MKKLCIKSAFAALIAFCSLFLIFPDLSAKPAPATAVGFVAGIEGRGYIIRNKNSGRKHSPIKKAGNNVTLVITGMDLLYSSDTVHIPRGSSARISICGGKGIIVRGESRFVLKGARPVFARGRASGTYAVDSKICSIALEAFGENDAQARDLVTGEKKGAFKLKPRREAERRGVYVVRGKPSVELFTNRILQGRPLIVWKPVTGRASYRIAVTGPGSSAWSGQADKNSFVYPNSAPALEEGTEYTFVIEAITADGRVMAKGGGMISLFSNADENAFLKSEEIIRESLPSSSPEAHILLGKLYEAHGLLPDAVVSYEKAVSLGGGNAGLVERIKLLKIELE